MKHPLYTYDDGTEVTASSVRDGKVRVYTERWDSGRDMFVNAEILIPDGNVLSSTGYSEAEVSALVEKYQKLAEDIIEYCSGKRKRKGRCKCLKSSRKFTAIIYTSGVMKASLSSPWLKSLSGKDALP